MAIITLISDLGNRDYYVSAIKGAILSENENVTLVDITHDVAPFDIFQASFNLRNAYRHFPKGTIHLIAVDQSAGDETKYLAAQYEGHYFLAADSGIFSMLFDTVPIQLVEIQLVSDNYYPTFPALSILAKAAAQLSKHSAIEQIGSPTADYLTRLVMKPVISDNEIRGIVVYNDRYGNAFTNITKELFKEVGRNRRFSIFFASYSISRLYSHYSDVPEAERVALFSSTGYLQIAINRGVDGSGGGANQLLGMRINHPIRVEFYDN